MNSYRQVFEKNRQWAAALKDGDPSYFVNLADGQSPEFLYIGCSDSRIPAEQIMGAGPGDIFVHRNVANVVHEKDSSSMAVLQFSMEQLKVKHIVVCGHYGCGGVDAVLAGGNRGHLNEWLFFVRDVYLRNRQELDDIENDEVRHRRLVELNVEQQCRNLVMSGAFRESISVNPDVKVHGWIFDLENGELIDLNLEIRPPRP